MLFLITVPANNARGPRYMEKALAAMHEARVRHPVTLIYGSSDEQKSASSFTVIPSTATWQNCRTAP